MAAVITLADPSMARATGLAGLTELAGDLRCGQPGQYLRVVFGAGQDVPVADVEERDGPGLGGAVDVGRHVIVVDELGVEWCLRLQRVAEGCRSARWCAV